MNRRTETVLWATVALVLVALSIPWFLWGTETVVAGLPLWLWWHVGWMLVTAVVLWTFTRRSWGIGIDGGVRNG